MPKTTKKVKLMNSTFRAKIKYSFEMLRLLKLPYSQIIIEYITINPGCTSLQLQVYVARRLRLQNLPQSQVSQFTSALSSYDLIEDTSKSVKASWYLTEKFTKIALILKNFNNLSCKN